MARSVARRWLAPPGAVFSFVILGQASMASDWPPVLAGGRVFLTGHEGDGRLVLCHDATAASSARAWAVAATCARATSSGARSGGPPG